MFLKSSLQVLLTYGTKSKQISIKTGTYHDFTSIQNLRTRALDRDGGRNRCRRYCDRVADRFELARDDLILPRVRRHQKRASLSPFLTCARHGYCLPIVVDHFVITNECLRTHTLKPHFLPGFAAFFTHKRYPLPFQTPQRWPQSTA